ncbi:MAG TPA: ATP-binding protein [Methanomicrobiales archaeon]|jgi:PAS domain S-box-containing protein|nr:ATP-binding protein [Methanomicrobiales archaeon]
MIVTQDRHHWSFWDYVLIGLVLLSVFIANIFIYYLYQGTVFVLTNFFYIPVIFAAFQYPKRGIFVSSSLALLYFGVIYSVLSKDPAAITSGTMQFYVFVAVGTMVSHLSNELREQELRYRGIFDHSEAGVFLIDRKDHLIVEANEQSANLVGYPRGELAGKSISMVWFDPSDMENFFGRLKKEYAISGYETRFQTRDGVARWVLLSASILEDWEIVCTVVDISERKQTEREIIRRNKELAIINQIGTAISTATTLPDLQKVALDKTLGFMDFDTGAIYLLQNGTAELSHQHGIPGEKLPGARELPAGAHQYARTFLDGVPQFFKDTAAAGMNWVRPPVVSLAMVPLVTNAGVVGAMFLGNTETYSFHEGDAAILEHIGKEVGNAIVKARLQLQLQEKIDEANLYIDIMTHDIHNANTISMGYAEILTEILENEPKTFANKLLSSVLQSSSIIDNVATIRRIHAERPVLRIKNLDEIIREEILHYPGAEISYRPSGFSVLADDLIPVIFRNLISNAIKFGEQRARVEITATAIGRDEVEVAVADTGPGISDDLKKVIFERFQRGKGKKSGKGLGLYITRIIVERYGGRIWAEDRVPGQPAQGAVIRFRLRRPA